MQISRRQAIAAILVLIIAATGIYVFFFNWDSVLKLLGLGQEVVLDPAVPAQPQPGTSDPVQPAVSEPKRISADSGSRLPPPAGDVAAPERDLGKEDFIRMAESFAERFGSFSNQSNFGNILDLKYFMSEKMKKWADSYIRERQGQEYGGEYFGVTTKAIGREITVWDEEGGIGAIKVNTRRRESSGLLAAETKVYSQDILINFIKENGAWKVDSAFWQ